MYESWGQHRIEKKRTSIQKKFLGNEKQDVGIKPGGVGKRRIAT